MGNGEFGPAALPPGLGLQQAPANSRSSSRQSRHSGSGACIRAYLPQLACIFGLFFSSPSFCVITGGASSRDGGASTCSCSIDVKRSWACFRGLLNFWGIHFSLFVQTTSLNFGCCRLQCIPMTLSPLLQALRGMGCCMTCACINH